MDDAHILATFLGQLIVLMAVGRLLGEGMARIGQPAIFGQLLAGVILGPSLFGALLPGLHDLVFPKSDTLKTMIDAVSQIGILLLLLLTGMETNIQLVRRRFRVVMTTSVTGIAVPFLCGLAIGYLIPDSLVPDEGRRLVTALFIGTALSISSVKIVAMVLMEAGFIRRDLGQLILATAILDDSIAWILISVIGGMAARGSIDLGQIGLSIAAAVLFLGVSLTLGRRLVARLIRWSNDSLSIEFPVVTTVLVITFAMALTTDLIGVHSALGAFVAGVVIGQAPILKGHIEEELRGLILAFFSPVFFAVAGLGMDLRTLADPTMIGLSLAFIAIASIGKTMGALAGGRLAGLSGRESLALGTGLNARGSTEVIIATIGMSLGVLSEPLYTMIVAMAIITTMAMPPTLRWALSRVPMREEERDRLEKEKAEEHDHLTGMERVLVLTDRSAEAGLALRLAGAFAAGQQILTTVLESADPEAAEGRKGDGKAKAAEAGKAKAAAVAEAGTAERVPATELATAGGTGAETGVERRDEDEAGADPDRSPDAVPEEVPPASDDTARGDTASAAPAPSAPAPSAPAPTDEDAADPEGHDLARRAAEAVDRRLAEAEEAAEDEAKKEAPARMPVAALIQRKRLEPEERAAEAEAAKGYNLLFAGLGDALERDGRHVNAALSSFLGESEIPVAIALNGRAIAWQGALPRHILVPTDGTQIAKLAAEMGVALARASGSRLTLLHVLEQPPDSAMLRRMMPEGDQSVLHQAGALARRNSVTAEMKEMVDRHPNRVIRRFAASGAYDLVVLGADLRQDGGTFLGPRSSELLRALRVPVLLMVR